MADLSKLKRRSSLGAPPPAAEASPNLAAPETAPAPLPAPELPAAAPPRLASPSTGQGRRPLRDGRTARRTGRTIQFATRVSAEFDERLRDIAEREGILLVEVLERALDAYEARRSRS
jgi:hypothetical protein